MKRFIPAFTLLTVAFALTGCGANREMEQRVLNLESHSKTKFNLLQQQNEFLNRKVNVLNDKVETLTDENERLTVELATYADRPYEVKLEIMQDLNTRFSSMMSELGTFRTNLEESVDTQITAVNGRVDTKFDETDAVLEYHTSFVNFVAVEQDSLNRVFALRLDERPWYESIIGKWQDKERADATNP